MSYEVTITHLSGSRQNDVETFTSLPIRIGRADECHVRFDPEKALKVSAEHAELRQGPNGALEIRDLDSRNGVWINGLRVEERAEVANHAIIEVGLQGPRLRVQYEAGAGGISFGELRRQKTGKLKRPRSARLASTEEVPTINEDDLASDEGPVLPLGLEPQQAIAIGIGVLLVLLGGCYFLS